jgi:hypothetical protein
MNKRELLLLLKDVPDDAELVSDGADCGGYDVEIGPLNTVNEYYDGKWFVGYVYPCKTRDFL